jgi:hypothetical protein
MAKLKGANLLVVRTALVECVLAVARCTTMVFEEDVYSNV